ncbi:hypothetical protein [Streptomyces sp. SP17KL33]|uniref:hypothetical protein n=1 Tax=Streptomyces sp. SP17KL33 TaxID=3002534 RepID=UPI003FCDFDEE
MSETVEQIAQPVTWKEGSLPRPVLEPLRHGQPPRPALRLRYTGLGTPAHAVGLSFSVAPEVRPLPGSLLNIYRELTTDLGHTQPSNGDLTPCTRQGVLLLNRALAAHGRHLVSILWGRDARNPRPLLGDLPSIESAHPSPMSADRGFFGQGGALVDWRLP